MSQEIPPVLLGNAALDELTVDGLQGPRFMIIDFFEFGTAGTKEVR